MCVYFIVAYLYKISKWNAIFNKSNESHNNPIFKFQHCGKSRKSLKLWLLILGVYLSLSWGQSLTQSTHTQQLKSNVTLDCCKLMNVIIWQLKTSWKQPTRYWHTYVWPSALIQEAHAPMPSTSYSRWYSTNTTSTSDQWKMCLTPSLYSSRCPCLSWSKW